MPVRIKYEEKEKAISLVKRGYSYTKAAKEGGLAHQPCIVGVPALE